MSYQRDREQFIVQVTREGLPYWVAERLLREATGFNRRAELACSSEAADRDRVPCPNTYRPKSGPCLCDSGATGCAGYITRITLQDWHAERRIAKVLAEVNKQIGDRVFDGRNTLHSVQDVVRAIHGHAPYPSWTFTTAGDPRGYTLRVIPPSYAERNTGRDRHNLDSIGVPARESGIKW